MRALTHSFVLEYGSSITSGHCKMRPMRLNETKPVPYLHAIRTLDFVKGPELKQMINQNAFGPDGLLAIATPKGKFTFGVEQKGSYLNRNL